MNPATDLKSERTLLRIRLVCIVVMVVLLVALWANAPYLIEEHSRLETWKALGLLSSDLVGFFWFLRFFVSHGILSEPLVPLRIDDGKKHIRRLVMVSIAAILLDLGFTFGLMLHERVTYGRSQPVQAEVVVLKKHPRELAIGYDLDCKFQDRTGKEYVVHVRALAPKYHFPNAIPLATVAFLSGSDTNIHSVLIRYDPVFPRRAWLDGMGWEDENGIYWFSIGTIAIQAAITTIFLALLFQHSKFGKFPWWWDTYKVLPLACEALCMLGMGLIDRIMDAVGK